MAAVIRGKQDSAVEKLKAVLDLYEREHPGSVANLYRQSSASIRIRVVDEKFSGLSKAERHDLVWDYLASQIPEEDDVLPEISILVAVTPGELNSSFASVDFDNPIPSDY